MPDPIANALRGKRFFPMLERAWALTSRYDFTGVKIEEALSRLARILDPFGCSATIPVTANALARHPEIAHKFSGQGLGFAIHGLEHVDYSLLPFDQQIEHIRSARHIFEKAGLPAVGFRSPYLRCNKDTIRALQDLHFEYDSSQALAWEVNGLTANDAYRHALRFYGAQLVSLFPCLPRLEENLVRIPYCLPDDEALVERWRLVGSRAITEIWLAMLEQIYAAGELFTLGLHPERVALCQAALMAVLEKARSFSPPVWIANLSEIASWHRRLGRSTFVLSQENEDIFRIEITAPPQAQVLARSVLVEVPTQTWAQCYRTVPAREFTFRCSNRPWIGLSPECPSSLERFLRHQGYLVETTTDHTSYSFFFQRKTFGPHDERPLLAELEKVDQPMIRLARWPNGAQAVLSVTGDVDALTLWDYGLRFFNR